MATSYPVQRRLFGLAAKAEATYGTAVTPTFATNAIRLTDRPSLTREWLAANSRENWFTGGLGMLAAVAPSGESHSIDFSAVIHGAGTAYSTTVTPSIHPFLLAAGFSAAVTVTASNEDWTYTYSDQPTQGLTVYTRMDGKEYHTVGAVVSEWSLVANAGEYPVFSGKLQGYAGATAVAEISIGTVTLPSTLPPRFKGATCTIGTYSPIVRSFELRGGNTVANRGDGTAAAAHRGFRITRRAPQFIPRIEMADITDFNPEGDWTSSTTRTMALTIDEAGNYNQYSISAGDMRVIDFTDEDDEGLTVIQPTYGIYTNAGTELQIVFAK